MASYLNESDWGIELDIEEHLVRAHSGGHEGDSEFTSSLYFMTKLDALDVQILNGKIVTESLVKVKKKYVTGDEHSMRLVELSKIGHTAPNLTPGDFILTDTFIGGSWGGPHHLAEGKQHYFICFGTFECNLTLSALRPFTWLLPGPIRSVARLLAHHLL